MRRFKLLTLIVVGLLVQAGLGSSFAATPRIALVIGNSTYAEAPLANPANDARLMAETLRGLGFEVIERIDADLEAMQLAAFELQDRLLEAGADAVGLFYYAGHGVQVSGQNYLIPLSANLKKEREVGIKTVSAGFFLKQMEFAGNRMNFVILDACRNNPLTRGFRSAARGLARMDAPRGSLVAYSTGPGEVAADGTGANSPYTLALSQAMQTPGVPAEKMFKLVRDRVMDETGGNQTPWEESSLTGADFYFSVDVSVAVKVPAAASITDTAATTQQESLFWQSVKDSTDPAVFEAYLEQYPNGTFATLARIRLKALKETQTAAVLPAPAPSDAGAVQPAVGVYPKTYNPGDVFKDCDACPEMVVVRAGSFMMGSPAGETGRDSDEGPQHRVTIGAPFAIGKYEVTFSEWDACVADGECEGYWPNDKGWGRGNRPVIYMSWKDAKSYVEWLSRKTGREYRLPSEAEWEYAARAGTMTSFHFGSTISTDQANYDGRDAYGSGRKGVYREKTVPVGSFSANAFGLHDVHGNVWEWVGDCWHQSYAGAPADGRAWTNGVYCYRVLRGGSWLDDPRNVRAAMRFRFNADNRSSINGFRIARTLP